MKFKKVLTGAMIGCLLATSVNHLEAKGRLKRALKGSVLGGVAGGAIGFGIGVLSIIGMGPCCPCCVLIPIAYSVLGVGTGAVSGGVAGAVTAKDGIKTNTKKKKKKKKRNSKRDKKNKKINKTEKINVPEVSENPSKNIEQNTEELQEKEPSIEKIATE